MSFQVEWDTGTELGTVPGSVGGQWPRTCGRTARLLSGPRLCQARSSYPTKAGRQGPASDHRVEAQPRCAAGEAQRGQLPSLTGGTLDCPQKPLEPSVELGDHPLSLPLSWLHPFLAVTSNSARVGRFARKPSGKPFRHVNTQWIEEFRGEIPALSSAGPGYTSDAQRPSSSFWWEGESRGGRQKGLRLTASQASCRGGPRSRDALAQQAAPWGSAPPTVPIWCWRWLSG